MIVNYLQYDIIMPMMNVIVNHAGAGTFMDSLMAEVPQLNIPSIMDQFMWS